MSGAVESSHSGDFSGPVSYWVEELSSIAEFGVDAFIFWPGNDDPLGQARLFGEEIVPALRTGRD